MDKKTLHQRLQALFSSQLFGVLATAGEEGPYSSLVTFAATPDLKSLIFTTSRTSTKFINIMRHGRVSMLIDNRTNKVEDLQSALAVTAIGTAKDLSGKLREAALDIISARHSALRSFASSTGSAVMEISVHHYLLVSRFQELVRLDMTG